MLLSPLPLPLAGVVTTLSSDLEAGAGSDFLALAFGVPFDVAFDLDPAMVEEDADFLSPVELVPDLLLVSDDAEEEWMGSGASDSSERESLSSTVRSTTADDSDESAIARSVWTRTDSPVDR